MPNEFKLEAPVIFYDGVCVLCNRFISFIFDRDKRQVFRFAPLQGKFAAGHLDGATTKQIKSIVYLDEAGVHFRSRAVLRILSRLGGVYHFFRLFIFVPTFISDSIYNVIAEHRYKWFGKHDTCGLLPKAERHRILE